MSQPFLNCVAKVHQIISTTKYFGKYFFKNNKNRKKQTYKPFKNNKHDADRKHTPRAYTSASLIVCVNKFPHIRLISALNTLRVLEPRLRSLYA